MQAELPSQTAAQVQSLAAEGRARIEMALYGRPSSGERWRIAMLRGIGAIAIGVLAAGVSILATVVILNLVMHFTP